MEHPTFDKPGDNISREIEHTRRDLMDTAVLLEDRFGSIVEDSVAYVMSPEGRKWAWEALRDNPTGAFLLVAGMAWLGWSAYRKYKMEHETTTVVTPVVPTTPVVTEPFPAV